MVVATGYGGPDVLAVVDADPPRPGPGEVLLAVRAAGVNPFDAKVYSGQFGTDPSKLPIRLGAEAAGVVTGVGDDAGGPAGPIEVGDEVIAYHAPGAYAEAIVVPGPAVVPKPGSMSWEAAGGLLLAGVTAAHAVDAVALRAGDTVLVHGASGGVGLMVVQLALGRGAAVIGTARPDNHDLLRGLGVTPVAYGPGLAERVRAEAPSGVTAAIDTAGTDEAVDVSVALVPDRSRIASIAAFGRADARIRLLGNGPGADPGTSVRAAARLPLTEAVADGRLRVVVAATYPLAEAADAHRAIMGGHTAGKIVLLP